MSALRPRHTPFLCELGLQYLDLALGSVLTTANFLHNIYEFNYFLFDNFLYMSVIWTALCHWHRQIMNTFYTWHCPRLYFKTFVSRTMDYLLHFSLCQFKFFRNQIWNLMHKNNIKITNPLTVQSKSQTTSG